MNKFSVNTIKNFETMKNHKVEKSIILAVLSVTKEDYTQLINKYYQYKRFTQKFPTWEKWVEVLNMDYDMYHVLGIYEEIPTSASIKLLLENPFTNYRIDPDKIKTKASETIDLFRNMPVAGTKEYEEFISKYPYTKRAIHLIKLEIYRSNTQSDRSKGNTAGKSTYIHKTIELTHSKIFSELDAGESYSYICRVANLLDQGHSEKDIQSLTNLNTPTIRRIKRDRASVLPNIEEFKKIIDKVKLSQSTFREIEHEFEWLLNSTLIRTLFKRNLYLMTKLGNIDDYYIAEARRIVRNYLSGDTVLLKRARKSRDMSFIHNLLRKNDASYDSDLNILKAFFKHDKDELSKHTKQTIKHIMDKYYIHEF